MSLDAQRPQAALTREPFLNRLRKFNLWSPSHRNLFGYALLLPAVLATLIIIVYPIFSAVDLSFQKVDIPENRCAAAMDSG